MQVVDLLSQDRGGFQRMASFIRDGQKVGLSGGGVKCQAEGRVCVEVL